MKVGRVAARLRCKDGFSVTGRSVFFENTHTFGIIHSIPSHPQLCSNFTAHITMNKKHIGNGFRGFGVRPNKKETFFPETQEDVVILLMEEVLHQLIGSLSHYLQDFTYPRWCRISSINSIHQPDKKFYQEVST